MAKRRRLRQPTWDAVLPIDYWVNTGVNRAYQTIMDWNALPDSLISSAEGAEDGVAKFISLVSTGD